MTLYELYRRNARAHLTTVRKRQCRRKPVTDECIDSYLRHLASRGELPPEIWTELQDDIRRRTAPQLILVSAETTTRTEVSSETARRQDGE